MSSVKKMAITGMEGHRDEHEARNARQSAANKKTGCPAAGQPAS